LRCWNLLQEDAPDIWAFAPSCTTPRSLPGNTPTSPAFSDTDMDANAADHPPPSDDAAMPHAEVASPSAGARLVRSRSNERRRKVKSKKPKVKPGEDDDDESSEEAPSWFARYATDNMNVLKAVDSSMGALKTDMASIIGEMASFREQLGSMDDLTKRVEASTNEVKNEMKDLAARVQKLESQPASSSSRSTTSASTAAPAANIYGAPHIPIRPRERRVLKVCGFHVDTPRDTILGIVKEKLAPYIGEGSGYEEMWTTSMRSSACYVRFDSADNCWKVILAKLKFVVNAAKPFTSPPEMADQRLYIIAFVWAMFCVEPPRFS